MNHRYDHQSRLKSNKMEIRIVMSKVYSEDFDINTESATKERGELKPQAPKMNEEEGLHQGTNRNNKG